MVVRAHPIRTLDDLRTYVHTRLCLVHDLESANFRMTEHPLVRGGRICGISFCVHGPRAQKLTAIWERGSRSVFFYGSTGERLRRITLDRDLEAADRAAEPADEQ